MMQQRVRARMAPFLMVLGGVLLLWGTFLAMVASGSAGPFGRPTLTPPTHADAVVSGQASKIIICSAVVLAAAALLTMTRVRKVGFLWRKAAALAVAVPSEIAARLWVHFAGLGSSRDVPGSAVYGRHATNLAHVTAHATHAGSGLVLITGGCVATLIGCVWPASKYRRMTIEYRVPRYGNPSIF